MISAGLVAVYEALSSSKERHLTSMEIAAIAGVSHRAAQRAIKQLREHEILDVIEARPSWLYLLRAAREVGDFEASIIQLSEALKVPEAAK